MAYPALRTQDQVISWAQQLTAQLERDRAAALGGLIVEPGITNGVATVDLRQGDTVWLELNQNITTFNIIPPRATDQQRFDWTLVLKQDSSGGRTVTWPAGFTGAPELSTDAGAVDVIDISLIRGTHFVRSAGTGASAPQLATQAEMEAGTIEQVRAMSPKLIAQAIAALAPAGGTSPESGAGRLKFFALNVDQTIDLSNPANLGWWRTGSGWTSNRTVTLTGEPPAAGGMVGFSNNSGQRITLANGSGSPLELVTGHDPFMLDRGESILFVVDILASPRKFVRTMHAWEEFSERAIPRGGAVGQVLAKNSAGDFDFDWLDPTGGTVAGDGPSRVGFILDIDGQTIDCTNPNNYRWWRTSSNYTADRTVNFTGEPLNSGFMGFSNHSGRRIFLANPTTGVTSPLALTTGHDPFALDSGEAIMFAVYPGASPRELIKVLHAWEQFSDRAIPPGGATGQVLGKVSGNDFHFNWINN